MEREIGPITEVLNAAKAVVELKALIPHDSVHLKAAVDRLQEALNEYAVAVASEPSPTVAGTEEDPPTIG